MNSVELIKKICKERHIAISRLEKELGFSNAYIANLKEGKMPADRLYKIAKYLDVTPEYLLTGEKEEYYEDPETARAAQAMLDNPELKLLFDAAKDSTPEDLNTVYQVLLALKRKERR